MNKTQIKQARQTNLAEYLLNAGVPLIRQGNRHRHKEHDSLVFTANSYYWNSRQEHGNSIDFLVRHMDMNFTSAVTALTNCPQPEKRPPTAFNANLSIGNDTFKVEKYLHKHRHIGRGIIRRLIENGLLFQEKHTNNAVFPMYDEENRLVGAELQGAIPARRFKGVKTGSKYGYGFNMRFSADNAYNYALFFESAIDLISFADYKFNHEKKSLGGCILVSMAGLKINVLKHTAKAFGGGLRAVLCVDNDKAGREFIKAVESEKIPFITCAPAEHFKDWNEQLTALRTSAPLARLMKNNDISLPKIERNNYI